MLFPEHDEGRNPHIAEKKIKGYGSVMAYLSKRNLSVLKVILEYPPNSFPEDYKSHLMLIVFPWLWVQAMDSKVMNFKYVMFPSRNIYLPCVNILDLL